MEKQENRYPLFEGKRVLKKELLWSLRDYAFSHLQLEYQEYGQGFLQGCGIRVEDGALLIAPGMVKCGRFICLLPEETRILYEPLNQLQVLRLRIRLDESCPDYLSYEMNFCLEPSEKREEKKKEQSFELCRFHLRKGARLRDQYTCFADMGTVYDTVNVIDSDWGGVGGQGLAPDITRYFAECILKAEGGQPEDRMFAYTCLLSPGVVPVGILEDYLRRRSKRLAGRRREELYQAMCAVIEEISQGERSAGREEKGGRRILVD